MIRRPSTSRPWRRWLISPLGLLLTAAVITLLPPAVAGAVVALAGSAPPPPLQVQRNPLTRTAAISDVSPPLRSLRPLRYATLHLGSDDNENSTLPKKQNLGAAVDKAVQRVFGPLAMPAPGANFDGEYNEYGPIPPDPNGDVGRNHYIQIVNSGFTIYDKSGSGVPLYGPANNNTLFIGFGGLCETFNAGDPVALYDPMADRWLLTWFTGQSNPTHQCIAVSSSPDPLGSWYRYDFVTSPVTSAFEDYPHLGVWPDAYYMTTNEFGTTNGGGNYAFERARMLEGDPAARMLFFSSADGGLLPSDFDGSLLPPAGSPNYFFEWFNPSPGLLNEYKFHVDWTTGTGTFTGPIPIAVADFNYPTCGNPRERCVPQPGTTAQLEVIGDRLMHRVAYRNFGSYESLVLNHTVNATGGSPGVAAPRWYELRDPANVAGATVFQQGTFYPGDGVFRWMGSIAQDRNGDIAMGYSAGNSTLFPSIRYAGRLPTDPPGTFGQGEATLFAGTGSEDFPSAPRWGDYSNLSIDPVDDCTFWYTQEYFAQTGLRDWRTRVGSFKFAQCTPQGPPTPVATATGTAPTATATPSPSPTACPGSISVTDSIANTDPTQTGRLGLSDPKSSCAVPKAVPALSDTLTRHYKSYNYTNTSSSAICVTVQVTQNCGDNAVQSVAYLNSFNPASIQTNYLADGGASGHNFSYSFTLPASQSAVVVMLEVSPNLGCAGYNLSINGCPPVPPTSTPTTTPTATNTSTPSNTPTATNTSTPTNTPTPAPSVQMVADPCDSGKTDLLVLGSGGNDAIQILKAGSRVQVKVNNASLGTFAPTGAVIVDGRDGNDTITMDPQLSMPRVLYGGVGNDNITGGNGPGILLGGDDADTLASGNGRDILIGGSGPDTLNAGNGDDILIAGSTSYDTRTPAHLAALLCAIQREWQRSDLSYQARINHLTGATPGGLNGTSYLKTTPPGQTVFDDSSQDRLTGANGSDWFLLNRSGGTVLDLSDRTGSEVATDLQ